jgi:hypothetical protein
VQKNGQLADLISIKSQQIFDKKGTCKADIDSRIQDFRASFEELDGR